MTASSAGSAAIKRFCGQGSSVDTRSASRKHGLAVELNTSFESFACAGQPLTRSLKPISLTAEPGDVWRPTAATVVGCSYATPALAVRKSSPFAV